MGSYFSTPAKTPTPTMAEAAFKHYPKAATDYKPPLIANENAYLGDVYSR